MDTQKRAVLLSACGPKTYQLIRNLVSPAKPGEKSFGDIVKLVTRHYSPKPSSIIQRFKFNTRVRTKDETIATYVASVRQLSEFRGFGDTLEAMLRDRLVCGKEGF